MDEARKNKIMKIFDKWGIKYSFCDGDLMNIIEEIISVFEHDVSLNDCE